MTELNRIKSPFNFIIFGGSGDLAKLKIYPALYELALQKRFPKKYRIFAYGRSELTDKQLRKLAGDAVKESVGKGLDKKTLDGLLENLYYHQGQYDNPVDYEDFAEKIVEHHNGKQVQNVAYLAVPPSVFKTIIEQMANIRSILGNDDKLILEKPFGTDETSATELFHFVSRFFSEDQIYLLDHYLGKVAVQSILPLRYTNTILNLLLKGKHIGNIQVNALETVGVEKRISYYEAVGVVKDMIQSHLLQILALFSMSLPLELDAESIKREKISILSALRYDDDQCGIVLGQYDSYQKEEGVKKDSKTPTFTAVRFFVDLLRWEGVPIYIRTGKQLNHKHTYVTVEFKKPKQHINDLEFDSNKLVIELYPEEKIQLHLLDEKGEKLSKLGEIGAEESLACVGDECLPEHGRLILDVFSGNQQNFLSFEEIIASWKFTDKLMKCVNERKLQPIHYKNGSEGPKEQHELTKRDGFAWYDADLS